MNIDEFKEKAELNLMEVIANFHDNNNFQNLEKYYEGIALINACELLKTDLPLEMAIYFYNNGLNAQELFIEASEGVYLYNDVYSCPAERLVPNLHGIITNESLTNPDSIIEDYFRKNLMHHNYKEKNSLYMEFLKANTSINKEIKQINNLFFEHCLKNSTKYAEMSGKYYIIFKDKLVYMRNHNGLILIEEYDFGDKIQLFEEEFEASELLIDMIEMRIY
jgi:hypothetical protein